jgi:hypothetical protein
MKKLFLSSVIVLFGISIMAQNSANLKLNLEKNKVYRFRYTAEQTANQTINGNTQTSDTKINNSVSIKMIDATAGFIITEVHLDTTSINSNAMGKTTLISSANAGNITSSEATDVITCIQNRLSKNALYVKMDFSGKVIEIANAKMLADIVLKDTSSITLTGMMRGGIKKQIENAISSKELTTQIEGLTNLLPGKEVSVGDKWTVTQRSSANGMSLDIVTEYHLDGIKGNNANITATSDIKASPNAEPMVSGPAKVTYDDLKGLVKSTLVIDTRTGLLIEEKGKSQIAGTLGISGPGFSMQMPMDINGETKVTAIQ